MRSPTVFFLYDNFQNVVAMRLVLTTTQGVTAAQASATANQA